LDGPSGAGKSTLAKELAKALGYFYVDTGAIYRTLSLFVLRQGVDPSEETAVRSLLPKVDLHVRYEKDGFQHMLLNGEDVTEAIRTPEVSIATSKVSAHPCVREYLLEMQRELANRHSVIMDGRDIGTVVLPNADVKIFLTATVEARAKRRYAELLNRGVPTDFDTVLEAETERDARDTCRAAAPLRRAEDAILVDTTDLSLEESFETLLKIIRERLR